MTERQILLKKISTYSFALLELHLFLDTHPYDMQTIAKIKEYKDKLEPLYEEFEQKYGPLTVRNDITNNWAWIKDPWPWDKEDNE